MDEHGVLVLAGMGLLLVLVIGQGVVLLGVINYLAKVQARLPVALTSPGGRAGETAPQFSAVDLDGRHIGTDTLRGKFHGLLFVSPHCPSCMTTLAEIHYLGHKVLGNLVVVCRGNDTDCLDLVRRYRVGMPTIADENDWLGRLFGVTATPTALLIDEDDRIMSRGEPSSPGGVRELLRGTTVSGLRAADPHGATSPQHAGSGGS